MMVCCAYPFGHDGRPELAGEAAHVVYARIRSRTFKQPAELGRCSAELQHLIKGMLTVDCAARLPVEQILSHPWMAGLHRDGVAGGSDGAVPVAVEKPELQLHWPPMRSSLANEGGMMACAGGDENMMRVESTGSDMLVGSDCDGHEWEDGEEETDDDDLLCSNEDGRSSPSLGMS